MQFNGLLWTCLWILIDASLKSSKKRYFEEHAYEKVITSVHLKTIYYNYFKMFRQLRYLWVKIYDVFSVHND